MINIEEKFNHEFIVGVPDSKLKDWLNSINYIMASNEGEAVGIATGYYLATGKRPTVFMSADGLCNALNPITSLVIPYQIPMDFIIGIRTDEPQHKVMGEKASKFLEILGTGIVPYNYILI
jgi:phosphonopyruvate decarboxylase